MRSFLLALPLSALLLAGCSGDDGDTASDDTTAATETTAPAETTVLTEETVADDGASEDICAQLEGLADIDPDDLPTQTDIDEVAAIAETAPPEIQDALVTIAEVGQLIADTGEDALADPEAAFIFDNSCVRSTSGRDIQFRLTCANCQDSLI